MLRKKLLGVIQFMQDCATIGILGDYDFNRLRHKLGLTADEPRPLSEFRRIDLKPNGSPRDLALMLGVSSFVLIDYPHLDNPAGVKWLLLDQQLLSADDRQLLNTLLQREFVVKFSRDDIVVAQRVQRP